MHTTGRAAEGPEMLGATNSRMTLAGPLAHDLLTRRTRITPGAPAVTVGRTVYTYTHLDQASSSLADCLTSGGVVPGDRVALIADSSIESVVGLWATLRAGAVLVAVNPTIRSDKLSYLLNDAAATAVIAQRRLAPTVLEAAAQTPCTAAVVWAAGIPSEATHPSSTLAHYDLGREVRNPPRSTERCRLIDADLAGLVYTAGPNGRPKGVMLTHGALVNDAAGTADQLGLSSDDTLYSLLPLTLGYRPYLALMCAYAGATLAIPPSGDLPRPGLAQVAQAGATVLVGDPGTMVDLLQDAPAEALDLDLDTVRMLVNTATPLPSEASDQLAATFPRAELHSFYGLPECPLLAHRPPDLAASKPTSLGRPLPNVDVYVVDSDGYPAGPGVVGELVARGSSTMLGYWRHPEETRAGIRPGPVEGMQVVHTGDQCWQDEDGHIYLAGRRDDTFLCRGERVSPLEIEAVLLELDAVEEAAVAGVPHELDGTAILATVVIDPERAGEIDTAIVREHCRHRLEPHLVPRQVQSRIALPRTDDGKIRRDALTMVSDHPALARLSHR